MTFLSILFFVLGFAFAYWFWLRPILKSRPQFAAFYATADSFEAALSAKFSTIKTRLASAVLMIASALIGVHDFLAPLIASIDWEPVTAKVPAWAWPIASFAVGALFLWLRQVTARTQDIQLAAVAAGASPEAAKAGLPAAAAE